MGRENEGIPSISNATPNQEFFLTKQYWAHTSLEETRKWMIAIPYICIYNN